RPWSTRTVKVLVGPAARGPTKRSSRRFSSSSRRATPSMRCRSRREAPRRGAARGPATRPGPTKGGLAVTAGVPVRGPVPPIRGESVREDLITLVAGARKASNQRAGKVTMCLLPELHRNPQMHERYQEVVEPRRQAMREVLERGITTGEVRDDADIELTLLMLSGPMLVQSMLKWNPNLDNANLAERIVDTLLAGIGPK